MVEPLRHRRTKGAETDMLGLTLPRATPRLYREDYGKRPIGDFHPFGYACSALIITRKYIRSIHSSICQHRPPTAIFFSRSNVSSKGAFHAEFIFEGRHLLVCRCRADCLPRNFTHAREGWWGPR